MLFLLLAACSSDEQSDSETTAATTNFQRTLYANCSLELISDGWNTGSDDYIETFEFDEQGNWFDNTWFAPYHGENEVDWFESQTFDSDGFLTGRSYTYDGEEGVYDVIQGENRFPETVTTSIDGAITEVGSFEYADGIDGYLDAVQELAYFKIYQHRAPATRYEIDEQPIDGDVDAWTEYVYDDDWRLISTSGNDRGGSEAKMLGEYTYSDNGELESFYQEELSTGDVYELFYFWDDDGRLSWVSGTNTDSGMWGEFTDYYTWNCP